MAPLEQFILFGDSLTEQSYSQLRGFAFGAELQAAYARRLDVINRGFSGYTTKNALEVISKALPTPEQASVRFLTIWFGANDANKNESSDPYQYIPIDQYKRNLIELINHPSVKALSPNIILLTPPPVEETVLDETRDQLGGYTGVVRQAKDAAEYAEVVKQVGRETGVPVVDVWSAFMERSGWKAGSEEALPGSAVLGKDKVLAELLHDGLHLGPEGYKIVFDELTKLIKEKWPAFPPYKMPYVNKVAWELERGDQFWDVNNDA
ncbi:GDSL Lipase/Acylhydrolase family protein-like protein [Xylogone sp. PMI_703]|nr:GDSL Lipase/Acylhydrolase family protein-like protein [Xylogone sp. PMI_703]